MKFIKANSKIITKMVVLQIGMMFLGFLLYIASSAANEEDAPVSTTTLALSIFSAVFYMFLLYVHVWEKGTEDKIRIDGGRMKYDPLKGLKAALVANSLNILLGVLSAIGYIAIDRSVVNEAGKFISPGWACDLYGIAHIIGQFLLSMYTGISDYFGIFANPLSILGAVVPGLAVSTVAYIFGTKERFGLFSTAPKR